MVERPDIGPGGGGGGDRKGGGGGDRGTPDLNGVIVVEGKARLELQPQREHRREEAKSESE